MKVLFFTYRTTFILNWVQNLEPYFKNRDIETYVFCLDDSFLDFPNHKGLNITNISSFNMTYIIQILKVMKPDALIVLGYRSLMELLMIRISKFLNIKTIYIQHGILSNKYISLFSKNKKGEFYKSFKRQMKYLKLFSNFVFMHHINCIHEIKIILNTLFLNNFKNIGFDKFLLFSQDAYMVHKKLFNFTDNQFEIIGYPVFVKKSNLKIISTVIPRNKKYVLYIHQNFIQSNNTKITYEEEREYLTEIIKATNDRGFLFVIQLHPAESIKNYMEFSKNENVLVIQNDNLTDIVNNSSFVIGHWSTGLLIPILLNKPLLIFNYPKLIISYDFYSDVGIQVKSLNYYSKILNSQKEIDVKKYNSFREKYLGTKNHFEDFANAIVKFIQSK
jgi:hypothetical protein